MGERFQGVQWKLALGSVSVIRKVLFATLSLANRSPRRFEPVLTFDVAEGIAERAESSRNFEPCRLLSNPCLVLNSSTIITSVGSRSLIVTGFVDVSDADSETPPVVDELE
jgi:hypothetical protein